MAWADLFNPGAQKAFWSDIDRHLFHDGLDGWWLDASEPEGDPLKDDSTFLGPGKMVRNAYPLFETSAVYQRAKGYDREQAGRDLVAVGICRAAAQRVHIVVRRHLGELGDLTAANPSRPQLRNVRLSLLDDRYRRFLPSSRPIYIGSLPRTADSMVRVRCLLPHFPNSRISIED